MIIDGIEIWATWPKVGTCPAQFVPRAEIFVASEWNFIISVDYAIAAVEKNIIKRMTK